MKFLTKNAIAILLVSSFLLLNSCEDPVLPVGNDADFTHFEFVYMLGNAKIDKTSKTIEAEINAIEDLSSLIPTFVLTQGATAYINNVVQKSGISENDFSTIVEYKIVSENGATVNNWKVIIYQKYVPNDPINTTFVKNQMIYPGTYNLDGEIKIADSIYLGLQPGVKLILGPNAKFIFGKDSRFVAKGNKDSTIIFTSETADWSGFVFNNVDEAEFQYCKIENVGQTSSQLMEINNSIIGITNSVFNNIGCTGFVLNNSSTFRVFDYNTLNNVGSDAGQHPIVFYSINNASNLGINNKITNTDATKGILIKDALASNNITLIGQDCPYVFEKDIECSSLAEITFFITNGVTIIMNEGKGIALGCSKTLFKVEGTENSPVVIKGKENTPGFWRGITINKDVLAGSNITHCKILNAGNDVNKGAICCDGTDEVKLKIQNCYIAHTKSNGIYFKKGATATLIKNTFENIGLEDYYYEQ